MLQGDELSVQLFIGATAISFLSIAMTQAGWTHRWFVRGMFAVAIVLGIAAIGWRYIEARIPLLGSTLQATTSSRVVWFFAGIVPALIGGVLLSDLLRRRRENQTKVLPPGWLEVMGAKETFARQDLVDRYAYIRNEIHNVSLEHEALDRQIAALSTALVSDVDDATRLQWSEELVKLAEQLRQNREKSKQLIWTQVDCGEALRMNIFAQLQAGQVDREGVPGSSRSWQFGTNYSNGRMALPDVG
jgi:hypothetical protein